MYKNVAGQSILVRAYDLVTDQPKTGDAANITATLSKDLAAGVSTNDVNPTEIDSTNLPGIYAFSMTQAESNADILALAPVSITENVRLVPVFIYTREPLADDLTSALDILQADFYIDKTQTPWELVIHKKQDTGTVLHRKKLYDVDGTNVTSDSVVVGKHIQV